MRLEQEIKDVHRYQRHAGNHADQTNGIGQSVGGKFLQARRVGLHDVLEINPLHVHFIQLHEFPPAGLTILDHPFARAFLQLLDLHIFAQLNDIRHHRAQHHQRDRANDAHRDDEHQDDRFHAFGIADVVEEPADFGGHFVLKEIH